MVFMNNYEVYCKVIIKPTAKYYILNLKKKQVHNIIEMKVFFYKNRIIN